MPFQDRRADAGEAKLSGEHQAGRTAARDDYVRFCHWLSRNRSHPPPRPSSTLADRMRARLLWSDEGMSTGRRLRSARLLSDEPAGLAQSLEGREDRRPLLSDRVVGDVSRSKT